MTCRIGVIGVGIIGEPTVRGLVRLHGEDAELHLSPRGAARSAALASELAGVHAEASNQEVPARSD